MKWFRLWVDILDDHKIAQLTPYEFQIFIFILACASEEDAINGRLTRTLPEINRRIRRRNDHFNKAVETFQRLELLTIDEQGILTLTNWNKRQFQSDKSYERVKKHRKEQAIRNVSVTVNETPPDTDTDTDTEKNKHMADFEIFYKAYPKKKKPNDARKAWNSLNGKRPSLDVLLVAIEEQKKSRDWVKEGGQFIPYPASWLRAGSWADETETPCEDDTDMIYAMGRKQ